MSINQILRQLMSHKGVNALKRAISFSTPFQKYTSLRQGLCQCPKTGNIHFYGSKRGESWQLVIVSMPLIGLYPFLPVFFKLYQFRYGACQCPRPGYIHFYGTLWKHPILGALRGHFCSYFGVNTDN